MDITTLNADEKRQARSNWQVLDIIVKFNPFVRRHAKHDFLGYVNLEVAGKPGTPVEGLKFFLNDCQAKILPKGFHLDMPSEKAAKETDDRYFSKFAPGTKVTRAVLEMAVLANADVQAAIEKVKTMERPNQVVATVGAEAETPFDGHDAAPATPFD